MDFFPSSFRSSLPPFIPDRSTQHPAICNIPTNMMILQLIHDNPLLLKDYCQYHPRNKKKHAFCLFTFSKVPQKKRDKNNLILLLSYYYDNNEDYYKCMYSSPSSTTCFYSMFAIQQNNESSRSIFEKLLSWKISGCLPAFSHTGATCGLVLG
jgi:hypothetical protein